MNFSPKRKRQRGAYNRALQEAMKAHAALPHEDNTPWPEFRKAFIKRALEFAPTNPRGRPPAPAAEQTDRQKYQATYQKARRNAQATYNRSDTLKARYDEFPLYWKEHKASYLPEGFLTNTPGGLVAKRRNGARDPRSVYRTVYGFHRRRWEANELGEYQRFEGKWENYWAYIKAQSFISADGEIPDLVVSEEVRGPNDDHVPVYSRIPPGWLGRKKKDQEPPIHLVDEAPVAAPPQDLTPMEAPEHEIRDTDDEGWVSLA